MYVDVKKRKQRLRNEFSRVKKGFKDRRVKFTRYGEPYWECDYCHKSLKEDKVTVDHFIPLAKSQDNSETNLRICCAQFNHDKGHSVEKCWEDLLTSNRQKKKKAQELVCDTGF